MQFHKTDLCAVLVSKVNQNWKSVFDSYVYVYTNTEKLCDSSLYFL